MQSQHTVYLCFCVYVCVHSLQLQKALGEKQTADREVVQEAIGSHNPGGTSVYWLRYAAVVVMTQV